MNASCSRYHAYAYDPVGNRLSEKTRKAETLYSYDEADELLSTSETKPCHRKKLTLYTYDQNGNQTGEGSTRYAYNLENKLIQVLDRHKKVSYTYTAEGLMATRVVHSETTSYSWDTRPDLPELAAETDSKSWGRFVRQDTTSYTYGAGAIGLIDEKGSYTFHTDLLGSVTVLSDNRGKLVESYRYEPYGEGYSSGGFDTVGGSELNSIRYTGQYLDSESDPYNMRAREYQPETGRFLEIDPIEAGAGETYLGVYIYADDQPTLKTDPSGMCVPVKDSLRSPCMRLDPKRKAKRGTQRKSSCLKNYPLAKRGIINGRPYAPDSTHSKTGEEYWEDSNALDLNVPRGTAVCALFSGRVLSGDCGFLGSNPKVDNGLPESSGMHGQRLHLRANIKVSGKNVEAYYAHLDKISVLCGSCVKRGQLIAKSGIGAVAHLHIGFYPPRVDVYRFIPFWRP